MLTLAQLYDLGNNVNKDIFEGITLPVDSPLDRDTLVNTIIEKCGLNYPIYADVNVMASAISVWSARSQYTFRHIGKIYDAEYSPIENKNYFTEENITRNRDLADDTTGSNTKNETLNSTITEQKISTHSGTDTNTQEDTTSAYNATTYQPEDKSVTTLAHGEVISDSGNGTTGTTKATMGTATNKKTIDEDENTKVLTHEHGNIGISTNNKLQLEEYEQMAAYNPYSFLAGLFENELTLFVY